LPSASRVNRDAIVGPHLNLGGGRGDGFQRGLHEDAALFFSIRDRSLFWFAYASFDVADAAFRLLDDAGDASFPLPPSPVGQLTLFPAPARLPLGRYLRQVVGEDGGGARAVAAVGHDDLHPPEASAPLFCAADRRIVHG